MVAALVEIIFMQTPSAKDFIHQEEKKLSNNKKDIKTGVTTHQWGWNASNCCFTVLLLPVLLKKLLKNGINVKTSIHKS